MDFCRYVCVGDEFIKTLVTSILLYIATSGKPRAKECYHAQHLINTLLEFNFDQRCCNKTKAESV